MENNYKIYNGEFEWLVKFNSLQGLQSFFSEVANELKADYDFKFEAMLFNQIATNEEFLEKILENQCWTNQFLPTNFFSELKKSKKIDFAKNKLMTLFLENGNEDIVIEIE